ncbi:hypothetical protein B4919_06340 [Francisella tularensis subsp. novicida]|uniref:RNA-directed DNA polymerase n=1 Tax=Francisella tularensis TaxID=263 RepID=UPI000CE2B275|nr:RNA-directed DNA polymerase [Francisella tularensis]AVC44426.1 hypothetical protein B4919_06340 [Francisella tularensis subsp. novicida]
MSKILDDLNKSQTITHSDLLKISSNYKRTYYDLLSEISKVELFDGLLGYGLFNEKLPPFLSSESFLYFCKNQPKKFSFNSNPSGYITYENIRNINIPRLLSIPNPISYYHQCKVLSDNWDKLLVHFENTTKNHKHKVSRIHIRKIDNTYHIFHTCYPDLEDIDLSDYPDLEQNHIFEMNHKNTCKDDYPEPDLLIGKKHIVKADISNCFPSIYTHSIPWALVGKQESKNSKNDTTKWFNQIDYYTRNIKEGETHGILIGCHTSNIISEVILTKVDETMYDEGYRYIRNIDDYYCYVKSNEEAEKFLIDLSFNLKKYGLVLNHKKTEILNLPQASTENWIRKLQSYVFRDSKLRLSDIRAYIDIAISLMSDNKENTAILNYAIKVLSKKEMTLNAKEYFIKTIHHLTLLYPYLIHILDNEVFMKFSICKERINLISIDIFKFGIEKNLTEAISYAIFFSLKYDFKLHDDIFDKLHKLGDPIILLLSYLHDEKYLNSSKKFNQTSLGKKYKNLAKSMLDNIDENWVFVYEVLSKDQLKDEWKKMKENGVTFLKEDFYKDIGK